MYKNQKRHRLEGFTFETKRRKPIKLATGPDPFSMMSNYPNPPKEKKKKKKNQNVFLFFLGNYLNFNSNFSNF